ncbi:MAG: L,D-transpeptidase family protein [Sphingomonas bacterium]|nr:L,D-transpeptidase family protein [Sphingomonas bacterium]
MPRRRLLFAALLLAPWPAAAQMSAPPVSTFAVAPSLSPEAALDRFYTGRSAPLWLEGGQLSAAGRLLLARLRTADHEGVAQGPALAARIDAALAAPAANPLAADRLLSAGWIALAEALNGPIAGTRYVDSALRPGVATADRILFLAAQAPDLAAHVGASMRKSRLYDELRAALIADAGARGGQADPRLVANLQRAKVLPSGGRYLFVNPATAQLMMVDNGEVVDRMRVVVGTRATPTAPMVSTVSFAILNPYWNVAEDLVRKIVAPHVVSQGVAYLKRANYEAVDKYGADAAIIPASSINWKAIVAGTEAVKLRQLPGKFNSMGRVKFPFPNDYGIFLHDTPNKPQFAKDARATSIGCIRLEDAARLSRWLFGQDPVAVGSTGDQTMRLPVAVPIYIAYITAQPAAGTVTWAKDVYAIDPA